MLMLAKCYLKYNSWTEWDIFTKLGTHVSKLNLWSKKKKTAGLPLGGAIRLKKHKNSYNYASVGPIDLKIVIAVSLSNMP